MYDGIAPLRDLPVLIELGIEWLCRKEVELRNPGRESQP
jgi:hypothetical protein